MENAEDKKTSVQTYESCGSFRIYSLISFVGLHDLKEQLVTEGFRSVGLAKSGWFDDYETRIESGIKIENIQMSHVQWCLEGSSEHRYLALYR